MKRIFLNLCLLVLSFFLSTSSLMAEEIGKNLENNISNKINESRPDEKNKIDISKLSSEDIFGDEQTFPFVAGLGKNAAH